MRHGVQGWWNGCHCDVCRIKHNAYLQLLKLRHERGQVWADPQPLRDLLDHLTDHWGVTGAAITRNLRVYGYSQTSIREGRRVGVEVASRLRGVTIDDFDDATRVWSRHAADAMDRVLETGMARNEAARRALGWEQWADVSGYERTSLRIVRALNDLHVEITRPRCEDCGEDPLAGGRWCLDCFTSRTVPSDRRLLDDLHRRRVIAERKRRERARSAA